ncbi:MULTISPECIES: cytidylate kinase-like family protein [Nocardiopsis]|uniref:Cytidylate kinase n=1 Tax=Nocardiopsis sinuspersici TaxID=501010 RepID=A0A1V3BWV8_9ACTN|nr:MULTISPECIES: cytidylate kinase family protein [Nocardiopsis]NYH53805.1 cytidylate kinase [Nocardiopsis sinuspersici]OOC52729.1 cytidylate kinase [Nocardiopsis sinuspersici]
MATDDVPGRHGAPVVTVSATYGAGGGVVGPAVAARLGVAFLDRAIPSAVAARVGCSLDEVLQRDDRASGGFERLLASAARLPTVTLGSVDTAFIGATDDEGRLLHDGEFVEQTERVVGEVAHSGGVVLGRAGAVVLADHPTALHVRMDGDRHARLRRARALWESGDPAEGGGRDGGEEAPTLRLLDDNDRARAAYVRRFYRTDPADPSHYHLVLDALSLSLEACVDLVVRAAHDRCAPRAADPGDPRRDTPGTT